MRAARADVVLCFGQAETRDVIKTYNLTTLADLQRDAPGFDWMAWATAAGIQDTPRLIESPMALHRRGG